MAILSSALLSRHLFFGKVVRHLIPCLWFFLIWGIGGLTACALRPTPPSPIALEVARLDRALDSIAKWYAKKDKTRLSLHLAPSFKDLSRFQEQIDHDFETFSKIELAITIRRVDRTKEAVFTEVYWDGSWEMRSEKMAFPRTMRRSGYARFGFTRDDPPRLFEVRGDGPWGVQFINSDPPAPAGRGIE